MVAVPASKIVNEQEVIKWITEGKTYRWISDEYLRKYNIETGESMWAAFRRRRGLPRRVVRNDTLIPWEVKEEHRYMFPVICLRREARRRAGFEISAEAEHELNNWLGHLTEKDVVVHYEPDTAEGWFYVPRRPGVDNDLIREPDRKTTTRPAAD